MREVTTSFLPVFTYHLPKRINRRVDVALQHQGEVDVNADHVQHCVKIHYPFEMTAFPCYQAVELGLWPIHLLVQIVDVLVCELFGSIAHACLFFPLKSSPKLPQVVTQPSDQYFRHNLTGRSLVGRNSLKPDHLLICHKSSGSVAGLSVRRLRNVPWERGRVLLVSALLLISLSQLWSQIF